MNYVNYFKKNILVFLLTFILFSLSCSNDIDDLLVPNLSEYFVYKTDSKYASSLYECSNKNKKMTPCDFSKLPLLGMESESPSKDEIMERLIVSHDWMGERFEELIDSYPKELLVLFRSVTAIVIGTDIRPSIFNQSNAIIYLDSNLFWLSESEKLTVNPKYDYRTIFTDTNVKTNRYVFRYLKEGEPAFRYIAPKEPYQPRTLEDIRYLVAKSIIHELLHANDFFPFRLFESMPRDRAPLEVTLNIETIRLSSRLEKEYPLTSKIIKELADYFYNGKNLSEMTEAMPLDNFVREFDNDLATDLYGYSSKFEDTAMLFEEVMMKILFDVDREIGFIYFDNKSENFLLLWGVRNRFADKRLFEKVRFILEDIISPEDLENFYNNHYPTLRTLERGTVWY